MMARQADWRDQAGDHSFFKISKQISPFLNKESNDETKHDHYVSTVPKKGHLDGIFLMQIESLGESWGSSMAR